MISDLRQVIAEQEKDLACINEEKRFFQMRLMNLERRLEEDDEFFLDSEDFEEVVQDKNQSSAFESSVPNLPNGFSIPPTIPECEEC